MDDKIHGRIPGWGVWVSEPLSRLAQSGHLRNVLVAGKPIGAIRHYDEDEGIKESSSDPRCKDR